MKKQNKMLEAIQKVPSSQNLSSKRVVASEAITPSQIISKNEPLSIGEKTAKFNSYKDELADFLETELAKSESNRGQITKEADDAYKKSLEFKTQEQLDNIKKVEEIRKQRDQIAQQRLQREAELAEKKALEMKKAAERLEESKAFSKGKILKKGGKFGALASMLGLGTSLLAPESKAAEIVNKIGEAASKADPSTYLQEGISDFDKKFKEMQDEAKLRKLEKQLAENEVKKVVEATGGEPDTRPSKAEKMMGEKESPDIEDMSKIINYEDYLNQRKRRFGY